MASYFINASGPLGAGDGSTVANAADASSTTKFNNIINAQNASGTTIVCAAGTYQQPLFCQIFSGVTIQGAGIGSTVLQLASGSQSQTFQPLWQSPGQGAGTTTGFGMNNLTLDFNAVNQPGWASGNYKSIGLLFGIAVNCTIGNVKFINFGSKSGESFLLQFGASPTPAGTTTGCTITGCIFTQPVPSGNTDGLTCVLMQDDANAGITLDSTNVVTNCQFLNLSFPTYSDLKYTQCVTAPNCTNNTATNVDQFWFVEPGSANSSVDPLWSGQTVTVRGNTLTNCGLARVLMHSNGSLPCTVNISNNTVNLGVVYKFFGGSTYAVTFDDSDNVSATTNPAAGPFTVTGNFFYAPASNTSPNVVNLQSTFYHVSSLTITNNILYGFAAGSSGSANSGSQWTVNTSFSGAYTVTGNTYGSISMSTPTLVNQVATGMGNTPVGTLQIRFPDVVLAGNCLVCFAQCSTIGSITSVQDNLGHAFTLVNSFSNTSLKKFAGCYVLPGATAGVTYVQINYSGLTTNSGGGGQGFPQAWISQWYNIVTSSPVDISTASGTTKAISMTTPTSGDLILYWALDLSDNGSGGAFNGTSIVAGSGFTLLSADRQIGSVVQSQVQATAGALTGMTCTTSGTATWGAIAVALIAAPTGAGTAPSSSAMRIVSAYHCSFSGNVPTGGPLIHAVQFPCTGNLLVGSYQALGGVTSVTDTGNSWNVTSASINPTVGSGQTSQLVFSQGHASSSTQVLTFAFASGTTFALAVLYDVVNAAASSFDKASTNQGNSSSFTGTVLPSVTPTVANGIVFNMFCISWDTVNGMNAPTGTGAVMDNVVDNLESNNNNPPPTGTAPSTFDEDAGIAHYYNPNTSAVSFTYTGNTSGQGTVGPGFWSAVTASFKPLGVTLNTVTVTFSATVTNADVRLMEYSGANTALPVDAFANATGTGTSPTVNISTIYQPEMVIAGVTSASDVTAPGSGFTQEVISSLNNIGEQEMVPLAATIPANATSTSGAWIVQALGLKGLNSASVNVQASLTGIPTAQAFGTLGVVSSGSVATLTGIPSAQAFGTLNAVAPAAATLTGIPTAQAFGAMAASATGTIALNLTGIPSAQAFGTILFSMPTSLFPIGIVSAEAFGLLSVNAPAQIFLTGIPSAEAFGNDTIGNTGDQFSNLTGIPSAQAFGTLTVLPSGTVNIQLTGIPSAQAFGILTVTNPDFAVLIGIPSAEAFGAMRITSAGGAVRMGRIL